MKKLAQGFSTAARDSNTGSRSRESEALPLSHYVLHVRTFVLVDLVYHALQWLDILLQLLPLVQVGLFICRGGRPSSDASPSGRAGH